MLGPAGARALDWLNDDLGRISTAVELGRWHHERAGLHVQVLRDGAYREVARVPDSGPISWHDVAVAIPALPEERSLQVRLSFLADHWRIDRIAVASSARRLTPRVVALEEVRGSDSRTQEDAIAGVSAPDDHYLQTNPGQRFYARFNVGASSPSTARTFLLSSQGYYTEWIRGKWIQTANADAPFSPTDQSLLTAMKTWIGKRDAFEKEFREARVPVK
jgi:hypothetical protein